ncbi:hypothetical protein ACXYX3_05515 [Mycobacterium sp. C3-094]
MADTSDVPGRLAQGRPAVEAMSEYVWSAHQMGFTDPDLTLHPGQMRDWYGTEYGMDLVVLQRDCAALDAAVRATREALAIQEDQAGVVSGAWYGSGAQAARQFLHRHGVASASVAEALAGAAATLRRTVEQLWRAVDAKVETTVAIESEVGAAREQWLTAATTVTSGVGDRVAAAELVDTSVKPFVQNRIGAEWLTAVQSTGASVAEAYRAATAEIGGRTPAVFEIPGALGPTPSTMPIAPAPPAPPAVPAPAVAAPAATAPAAWTAPVPSPAPPPATPLPPDPPPATPLPAAAPPLVPPAAPLSDLGGGGAGGAIPAVGQRFADALSGLLGGGTGGEAVGGAIDPPVDIDPPEPPDPDDEEVGDDSEDGEAEDEPEDEETDDEPDDEPAEEPEAEPGAEEPELEAATPPAPTPPPPPAEALPPPPPADERTPCDIAADEVPQVGPPPATGPGGG